MTAPTPGIASMVTRLAAVAAVAPIAAPTVAPSTLPSALPALLPRRWQARRFERDDNPMGVGV